MTTGKILLAAYRTSNQVYNTKVRPTKSVTYSAVIDWHTTFGHTSPATWTKPCLYGDGDVLPSKPDSFHCDTCIKFNLKYSTLKPPKKPRTRAPYDLVHTDLMGPITPQTQGKKKYTLTLIEDQTHYSEDDFLHSK